MKAEFKYRDEDGETVKGDIKLVAGKPKAKDEEEDDEYLSDDDEDEVLLVLIE